MLTEREVKDIKGEARVRYFADGRTGLRLRVYPSGSKKWVWRTEAGGKTRERVLGQWPQMPVAEARRRVGTAPRPVAASMTFEQAAQRWHAERIVPRYRASAGIVWRYIERDCSRLFSKRLDSIKQSEIAALIESKRHDGENAAGKLLRLLRKLFRWALLHQFIAVDPTAALSAVELGIVAADPRERIATDAELRAVWTMPAPHGPMLRFALLTACRIGEARAAEADQFSAGTWTIPQTKSGRPHRVPLASTAARLLATGWELRSPEALYHALHRAVPGLKPHDLRRTAATRMRELGVSTDVIEAILNHAPPKLRRTYQLPDMQPAMRDALLLWERALLRIVGKK